MKKLLWIAPAIFILIIAIVFLRPAIKAKFAAPPYSASQTPTPEPTGPEREREGVFAPAEAPFTSPTTAVIALDIETTGPLAVTGPAEELTSPALASLQFKGSISGKVTDLEAKPIAEAKLIATGRKEENPILTKKAQTDSSGLYLLSSLPPGNYEIAVQHPDYATAVKDNTILQSDQALEGIDFVLTQGIPVKGKVIDEQQAPISGVAIDLYKRLSHLNPSGGSISTITFPYSHTQTNENGQFELLRVSSGEYRLECKKPGYPREWLEMAIEESQPLKEEIVIVLRTAGTIAGRVINSENAPVPGAQIQPKFYSDPSGNVVELKDVKSANTDEKGYFVLEELYPSGYYDVQVSAPGYTTQLFFGLRVNTTANELRLSSGGALSGRITFFESEEPAGNIKVTLKSQNEKQSHSQTSVSNRLGFYYFAGVPAGKFIVNIDSQKYTAEPRLAVQVESGKETTGIDFKIYEGLIIRGTVVDAITGLTVAEAKISAQARIGNTFFMNKNMSSQADATGRFELTCLHQGIYYISAQAKGYFEITDHRRQTKVVLRPGDPPKELTLKLYSGGSVSGEVINKEGTPVAAAIVKLYHPPGAPRRLKTQKLSAVTEPGGHFTIGEIDVSQACQLVAAAFSPGYAPGKSKTILLTPKEPYASVKIVLGRGQSVSGQVVDEESKPLSYVRVELTQREFAPAGKLSRGLVFTDGQGTFAFYDIAPGSVLVKATLEGYLPAQKGLTVVEGKNIKDVQLVLTTGNAIAGTVLDDLSQPVVGANINARPQAGSRGSGSAKTDNSGFYQVSKLSTGQFRITASFRRSVPTGSHHYSLSRGNIPSGTEQGDFIFPINGILRGRVFDEITFLPVEKFTVSGSTKVEAPFGATGNFGFGTRQFLNSTGEFEIQGLPTGVYRINIRADGYLQENIDNIAVVSPSATDMGSIMLTLAGAIKLRLLSELTEEPISGVRGKLENGPSARSNHDGHLQLGSLKPGMYKLTLTHGHYMKKKLEDIIVEADKVTDLGNVYLEPGGAIEGEVTDDQENPLANVKIQAEVQDFKKEGRTNIDGYYFIDGIKSGTTRLIASARINNRDAYKSKYITIKPDEVHRVDFVFDLGHKLQGTIYAANFSIRDIKVAAYPIDDTNSIYDSERIEGNITGRQYSIDNLVSGYYMLIAEARVINRPTDSSQEYISQFYKVNVYAPQETRNIEFNNAMLAGRTLDKHTQKPRKAVKVTLTYLPPVRLGGTRLQNIFSFTTQSIKQGFYRLYGLPEGRYKVFVKVRNQPEIHYETIDLSYNQHRENYTIYIEE